MEKQIENIEETENNLVLVIYSSMQEEEFGNKYNYYGELIQRDFKAKEVLFTFSLLRLFICLIDKISKTIKPDKFRFFID